MELIEYIYNLVDPFWATFIASMIPVGELRIGIPLGVMIYEMNLISAFIAGFLGNYLIVPLLLYGFGTFYDMTKDFSYMNKFYTFLFKRTRKKTKVIKQREFWGLALFVAIPLPMTGAWTGCLAAFLLGINRERAMVSTAIGLFASATLVTIFSSFFYNLFS